MVMEIGRLVYDVEVKETSDNKIVLNNRMAIQNSKDDTVFIDIVAFGSTAEIINKYYHKGFEILVQGRLFNKIKKKDNLEYNTVALLVDKVIFTYGYPRQTDIDDAKELINFL